MEETRIDNILDDAKVDEAVRACAKTDNLFYMLGGCCAPAHCPFKHDFYKLDVEGLELPSCKLYNPTLANHPLRISPSNNGQGV